MAAKKKAAKKAKKPKDASKDEQIGFHKGSLMTLAKEREELVRILSIVEQLMQMHNTALKEHGVEIEQELQQANAPIKKSKPPIEDIL
ncbi:MAG: hypothetical protein OXR66_00685 [Candidatus Woesearchaeota archaeon]|nr:hypothetical protein [Candidatus Woesearchaeota archaeon]